jgi:hypothetical protein
LEPQAYLLIRELHKLVVGDGKRILSSSDIASLEATLHSLITLYAPDTEVAAPHDLAEARRPPVRPLKREKWYQKILG